MITAWTKHIPDPVEKQRYRDSLQSSKWVLDRLQELLVECEGELNEKEISPKNYEVPNWDYRQAHNNGFRQCLKTIMKIIDFDQKDRMTNGRQPAATPI